MDGDPGIAWFERDAGTVVEQIAGVVLGRRAGPRAGYMLAIDEVIAFAVAD